MDADALRFRHGAALFIESPSIGGALAVRRFALQSDADQQRAMEPAAILIAAFQIHIGGPRQAVFRRQNGEMAGSGVEPDIENVSLFAKFLVAAARALDARADEIGG